MDYNNDFWTLVDTLIDTSDLVLDRPRGTAHPRYPQMIYPLDYGYLAGTSSADGQGIDVWMGSHEAKGVGALVGAILCCVDVLKHDMEIKLLIGCTEGDIERIVEFMNDSSWMRCIVVHRTEAME